jgi:large subunit ribosomal protein L19
MGRVVCYLARLPISWSQFAMRPSALDYIESKQLRKDLTDFRTGDTVRVHWKVREGEKERVQPFEGVVIRKTKGANRATFTVRKMSYGVGVERIFPLHSPRYERIEVLTRGDVRHNRLFYLRDLRGKASRVDTQEELEGTPAGAPETTPPAEGAAPAPETPAPAAPAPKGKKGKAKTGAAARG